MKASALRFRKFKAGMSKFSRYEFWPFWFFFFPMVFYWLYLSLRARSFTYFTASNPGIDMGGLFGEEKNKILDMIPPAYLPHWFCVSAGQFARAKEEMENLGLQFPVIAKPNVGERGRGVAVIENAARLRAYLSSAPSDTVIQEYVQGGLELGIFYYRYPSGKGSGISSVVIKEFLSVEGNGKETLFELMLANSRAIFQLEYLTQKFGNRLHQVLPAGEKLVLEPIGNHCRGTKFLNGSHLINERLVRVFDHITRGMQGFYFGRFDLKAASLPELYEGKGIHIMEVNGVTSEPGNIYQPGYGLLKAYREVARHMKIAWRISLENHSRGIEYVPARQVAGRIRQHFSW